jgi:hypothetical protein
MSYKKNTHKYIRTLQMKLKRHTRKLQLCYEKYRRLEVLGLVSTPV